MRVVPEPLVTSVSGDANRAVIPSQAVAPPQKVEANHVVEYRVSLPFFGGRYYFAFFSGRCQRSFDRISAEGQRRSWAHASFSFGTLFLVVSTMLMCGAATAYLVKSLLGIDLFDDHFAFHYLFFN